MALPDGVIGETIKCYIQASDTLDIGSAVYAGGPKLYLMTRHNKGGATSIYMDREKVEELATYLMYWLHETKDAE